MLSLINLRNSLILFLLLAGWSPQQALAAPATHFLVTVPATTNAGTPFTATVTAQDQYGNPVITSDTFQVNTDDPLVSNPAVTGVFAAASTATVSLTLKTAGSHVLTPVDTSVVLPGTSIPATVVVNAAGLDHLKVTAPTPQVAGTPFTATVTAQDQYGNPVITSDTFQVNTDDPLVSNPAVTGVFAAASTATVSLTLKTAGSHVLTPVDTSVVLPGTSIPATVAVNAAGLDHLKVTAPTPQVAGTPFTATVTAQDQYGNPVITSDTFQVNTDDPLVSNPAAPSAFVAASTATVSLTLKTAGSHVLTPVDTSVVLPGTSIPATVAVNAAGLDHLKVTAPTPQVAGTPFTATVTAQDQYGNPVITSDAFQVNTDDPLVSNPAVTGAFAAASTATVSLTLKTAGSHVLTPVDTSVVLPGASIPATVVVNAAGLDHLKVTAPTPQVAGTPFTATVTAQDQFGNPVVTSDAFQVNTDDPLVSNPAVTGAFAAASTATVSLTLKTAGSHVLTPSDTMSTLLGPPLTATVAISPGPATHFTLVAPGSTNAGVPFTTNAGVPFTLAITARDAYGNVATGYAGTFALTSDDPAVSNLAANQTLTSGVGTLSAILYTSGNRKITAKDSATATITGTSPAIAVSSQGANHFQVSAPISATAGISISVTVTAFDQFNNKATTYTGTVTISSTDGSATLGAIILPTNTTLANGVGSFAVTLKTAGTQTITATDSVNTGFTGTTNTLVVNNVLPTIDTISPATKTAGDLDFDLIVTNTDSSYLSTSVVNWNGAALVTTLTDAKKLTALTAKVPASLIASAGSATITVTNPAPGGGTSLSKPLTINSQTPAITSLTPTAATRGDSVTMTINGTGFQNGATVQIGTGTTAIAPIVAFVSSSQLTATFSIDKTYTPNVYLVQVTNLDSKQSSITNPDGTPLKAAQFTIMAQTVAINSLTPPSVVVTTNPTVTQLVTITGTGFRSPAVVAFQGTKLSFTVSNSVNSASQITATISGIDVLGAADVYTVTVTNPDKTVSPTADIHGTLQGTQFSVSPQAVSISSLDPNTAIVGDTTKTVTIHGSGFVQGASVIFGIADATGTSIAPKGKSPIDASLVTVSSPTVITVKIRGSDATPANTNLLGTVGDYQIQVINPDGSPSGLSPFMVKEQIVTITNISPSAIDVSGINDPPVTVTVNGTGFNPGASISLTSPALSSGVISALNESIPSSNVTVVSSSQINITLDNTVQALDAKGKPEKDSNGNPVTIDPRLLAGEVNITVTNTGIVANSTNGGIATTNNSSSLKIRPLGALSAPTFNAGLQFFSIPYYYTGDLDIFNDLNIVGASNLSKGNGALGLLSDLYLPKAAFWDGNQYQYSDKTPFAFTLGSGYWINFPGLVGNVSTANPKYNVGLIRKGVLGSSLPKTAGIASNLFPIVLHLGWNMIGDPYISPVIIGSLQVQPGALSSTVLPISYADAVNFGIINGTLYSYDSAGNKYAAQDATKTLDPYVGYWILALQPCTLLVPQP